jgi:hypothetical protein
LYTVRRRFQEDLVLEVVLEAVRIFAVATIGRSARRLYVGYFPRFWSNRPEESMGAKSARPFLGIVGLGNQTTLVRPELI